MMKIVGVLAVAYSTVAEIATELDAPLFVGCPSDVKVCTDLQTLQVTNLGDDLQTLENMAKECVKTESSCSVTVDVVVKISGSDICKEGGVGFNLGSLPTGWEVEQSVYVTPAPEICIPTGGRYSDGSVDVCSADAGTAMISSPIYMSGRFSFPSAVGPNLLVAGCEVDEAAVLQATLSRRYFQDPNADDNNAESSDAAASDASDSASTISAEVEDLSSSGETDDNTGDSTPTPAGASGTFVAAAVYLVLISFVFF